MEIGVDSFIATTGSEAGPPAVKMAEFLSRIESADQVDLDIFGVGEHHRKDFLDSAPTLVVAAAAASTRKIRLTSAVTVLRAIDSVRAFQVFVILDSISEARAEMVVGRGSFIEAFPLFGRDVNDYDLLVAENLNLHLNIGDNTYVHCSGMSPGSRFKWMWRAFLTRN